MIFQSGLTNQFCFAYISKKNEGDNKRKVNNAPHLTIRISSTTHFSTFDQHG